MEGVFTKSSRGEKIFRWCNIALDLAIVITLIGLAINYKLTTDPNNRFSACLIVAGVMFVPYIYELIFRSKLPNAVFLIFNLYVAMAGLWGSALNGYSNLVWLDIVVHFIMGYLMAMLGLFIICRGKQKDRMHFLMIAFFCLCFSLFIEGIWEIFEWVASLITSSRLQGGFVEGYNAPLVTDTMEDICCNLGGATLFFLHYLISKLTKKNLFISSMEKEFMVKHKLFENSSKNRNKNNFPPENISEKNAHENNINSEDKK